MVYTERDGLLGAPGKRRYVNKTWLSILGAVFLFGVICVAVTLSRPGESDQVLLAAAAPGENEAAESENNQPENTLPSSMTGDRGRRNSKPVVTTTLGKVKGVILQSRGGRDYNGFYNIPYAEPPIGDLRFESPVPVKSWRGTRDGTVKGEMCIQISQNISRLGTAEGSEDCLHVNVFTPKLPRFFRNPNLPVLVYFFGGGFMFNTANNIDAQYFMDEDVILVIVEARVGALGFLNTGDMHARGNMGLKDQAMAMRWVKENIVDFGGDPTRVVAFGTSSGGMSAHGHLISPMTKGLFSRAISVSGTMNAPGIFNTNPKETAQLFGKLMNCPDTINSEALVKCLRNASTEDIALRQPPFSPSLEAIPLDLDGDMSDVFFPDTPLNLLLTGQGNSVPWLVGVNSAEAILVSYALILFADNSHSLNQDWRKVLPLMLQLGGEDKDQIVVDEITSEVYDFYFGNRTISHYSDIRLELTNLLSDRVFIHPTKVAGMLQAKLSPVFWYYLSKEGNSGSSFAQAVEQFFDPPYGVSHADELQYLFSTPQFPYIPLDSEYADFSIFLVKLFVSFAATGAPVNPHPNGATWPKVDPNGNGSIWFNLDDEPKLIEPFTERLKLWDSFPMNYLYD